MPVYQQQPWDRWHHGHQASQEWPMGMVVSSPAPMQRSSIPSAFNLPTTYSDSPVTPMATAPYSSQSHFSDYQAYSYQPPTSSGSWPDMPVRSASRLTAPPTPPLDEERAMRYGEGQLANSDRGADRRASRKSLSVKSEADSEAKDIKTCPKYVKTDGTLQFESQKPVDVFLKKAKMVMRPKQSSSSASTPESMPSPAAEEQPIGPKGLKKYACSICPQRFHQRAQLKTHTRSHTGEKPHQCDICGMRVSQPGNLKAHKRKHTSEKPYSCDICNTQFSSNGGLKVHVRNKHEYEPKKPCPMEGCKKEFSTIGNMKVHIGKFHEKELEHYLKMMNDIENFDELPEKLQTLLSVLVRVYKNSNCGIKGRGAAPKVEKDKSQGLKREPVPQEMTPVSPASSHAVHDYRQYYDHNNHHQQHQHQQPQQQQQYQGLPYPAQLKSQQSPGFMHSPMHQPQYQMYQGLPHPGGYSLGWTPI